ncbi:MAG: sulfurtransferase [Lentisphaeraceae bacterium]|nr:sulfurtransferase [Lentisphaeraceae bacterium]
MKKHSPAFLAIVNDAKTRIKETNIEEVHQRIENGDRNFRMVDVREAHEWNNGFISGAEHIGKGVMERDAEKTLTDKNEEIILYCGGGFRSALVADNLQKMGYINVLSMDGGFSGWKKANYEITREDT